MSFKKKLIGCCSVCDEQVFCVTDSYPQGHPYEGEPRSVNNPSDNAWRVTLLLSSGDHVDVTMCTNCLEGGKLNFNDAWNRIKDGWKFEVTDRNHLALQKPVYTDKQKEQVDQYLYKMCQMSILGILCRRPWRDVPNG